MKKLFLYAVAALTIVGCTNDTFLGDETLAQGQQETGAIDFGSGFKAVTRTNDLTGAKAAAELGENFAVFGTKAGDATNAVFDWYNVYWDGAAGTTETNTKGWEYVAPATTSKTYTPASLSVLATGTTQSVKYWDKNSDTYDFWAYSVGGQDLTATGAMTVAKDATATDQIAKSKKVAFTGTVAQLGKVYVSDTKHVATADYGSPVELKFRAVTSKVRIAFYENVAGYKVKGVKFYTTNDATSTTKATSKVPQLLPDKDLGTNGKITAEYSYTTGDKGNNGKTAITISDVTTAESNLLFGGEINYTGGVLATSNATPSYANGQINGATTDPEGNYVPVLPLATATDAPELTVKVDYTLVSEDASGEEIDVYGATAHIPAIYTNWQPNYAYTYIFKITKQSGSTDPDEPNNPEGLTCITFDAMVAIDDAGNTYQETITTLTEAPASITTFGVNAGTIVKSSDDYEVGTDVYASFWDNNITRTAGLVTPVVGTNVHVYKVKDAYVNKVTEGQAATWAALADHSAYMADTTGVSVVAADASNPASTIIQNVETKGLLKLTAPKVGKYVIEYLTNDVKDPAVKADPDNGIEEKPATYWKVYKVVSIHAAATD